MHRIEPKITTIKEKRLVGKHLRMSLGNNKTGELWADFMPQRKTISNALNPEFISMQIYPESFDFNPHTEFEKWAAVEVVDFENTPNDMESFTLKEGLYAVFHYKGLSSDSSIFHYIFGTWLPQSGYVLDSRPHFEILGEKYKNNHPDSEEDIYIPIKEK